MKYLSDTKASIILLALMAIILAAATMVEHFAGSAVALTIYHNIGAVAIWTLLVVNWALIWCKLLKSRKIPLGSTLLHLSFAVMLTGAFVTMTTSVEGQMPLERGETKGMILKDNGYPVGLPFTVGLDSLEVSRYPGTGNPSGFTSYVTVSSGNETRKLTVSVNHPLRIKGWRIYQASYMPETGGSIFSIVHDTLGTTLSYIGYALLLLAFILLIFSPGSRFSKLRKQLAALSCMALLLCIGAPRAAAAEKPCWDKVVVQDSHGRIVTMDSYCRELMRKIHHSEKWDGQDAIGTVLKIIEDPDYIYAQPFIYQKNKEVAALIGQEGGKYAKFSSFYTGDGFYKLQEIEEEAMAVSPNKRSKFQKDALKFIEKASLLYSLLEDRDIPMFPKPGTDGEVWISADSDLSAFSLEDLSFIRNSFTKAVVACDQACLDGIADFQRKYAGNAVPGDRKLTQEVLCNRIKPFKTGAMGYMLCALLLMVCSLLLRKNGRLQRGSCVAVLALTALVFALHSWGIAARWYCSGQVPLSNSYEVTVFLSWCIALLSLVLSRRSSAGSAFGLLFAGALLLVAGMNNMDPAVTPLMPVLQSPWLMFHVAVIIAGYACFGINFLLSVYGLGCLAVCGRNGGHLVGGQDGVATKHAAVLAEIFALVGLMLMTVGTFLGAVWAGESWGTYWSWDPKETWALITMLVYAICTHARLVPKLNSPKWLFILSIIGMLCVLMTYFGVNYFLVGMHSYAS